MFLVVSAVAFQNCVFAQEQPKNGSFRGWRTLSVERDGNVWRKIFCFIHMSLLFFGARFFILKCVWMCLCEPLASTAERDDVGEVVDTTACMWMNGTKSFALSWVLALDAFFSARPSSSYSSCSPTEFTSLISSESTKRENCVIVFGMWKGSFFSRRNYAQTITTREFNFTIKFFCIVRGTSDCLACDCVRLFVQATSKAIKMKMGIFRFSLSRFVKNCSLLFGLAKERS